MVKKERITHRNMRALAEIKSIINVYGHTRLETHHPVRSDK